VIRFFTVVPLLGPLTVGALVLGVLTGCSGDDDKPDAAPSSHAPTSDGKPAKPAPRPRSGQCYKLSYDDALAPTASRKPVSCKGAHTGQTFYVGSLSTDVDGHLLAVDSKRVRAQIATQCPRRFSSYVGGSTEARRLSMLATAWFSPTVEQSDRGQTWFRCDLIALDSPRRLAQLTGRLENVLDSSRGRARWARCATGKPGTKGSEHVLCSRNDAWRAVSTIDVPAVREGAGRKGAWPGEAAVKSAGDSCEDEVRAEADNPLSFSWGYEWPTRKQWNAGQHYGFCWAPKSN
jgi:hypothetical protein